MPKPKTMKSGSPDDFQTEPAALDYIVPYLKRIGLHNVWEPACGNGNLVKAFDDIHAFGIMGTDIKTGLDFLKDKPPENYKFDCIVTNPPFSLKEEFMGRCYQLGKPWALLMPITTFDSKDRRKLMDAHGIEIIFPDRRIKFETPNHSKRILAGKNPGEGWFYTAWFTSGLRLPKQLVFSDPQTFKI